jgi:hypothetical protein
MCHKTILIISLFLLSGYFLPANAQNPCTCADQKDMLYRIREADTAINEYQKQIQNYEAQERISGKTVMFTQAEYRNVIQPILQTALNNLLKAEPTPKPNTATGSTDPNSCDITINERGSPCLRESAQRHENHHSNECKLRKPPVVNQVSDYRDQMRIVNVLQEEIRGYTIEKTYLSGEYAKLPDGCKPPNWFLSYTVQVRYNSPPSKSNTKEAFKNWQEWKIDHKYSISNLELSPTTAMPATPPNMQTMTPAQQIQATQNMLKSLKSRAAWSHQPADSTNLFSPISFEVVGLLQSRWKIEKTVQN